MSSTLAAPTRPGTSRRVPAGRPAAARGQDERPPGPRGARLATGLALVAVVGAGVAGARLALPLLQHPGEQAALASLLDPTTPGLTMGQHVRTSFGSLTVGGADINNGLSQEDLGGMNHGVSSLVSSGQAQVTVAVTLTAETSAVTVGGGQFRLLAGKGEQPTGTPTGAAGTTFPAGELSRRTSVDGRISFVTPTDGSHLWLQYTDPGSHQVTRVALGQSAVIGADTDAHAHHAVDPVPMPPDPSDPSESSDPSGTSDPGH